MSALLTTLPAVLLFLLATLAGLYSTDGNTVLYPPLAFFLAIYVFQSLSTGRADGGTVRNPARVWLPALALVLSGLLCTVMSPTPIRAYFELFCPASLFLVALVAGGSTAQLTRALVAATLLPAAIAAAHGIGQVLSRGGYAHAQFLDPNMLAGYLFASMLVALGFFFHMKAQGARRWQYASLSLVVLLGLAGVSTQSRGAWFGLIASIAVVGWAMADNLGVKKRHILMCAGALVVVATVAVAGKLVRERQQHAGWGASITSRVALLKSTVHMIQDHPLSGVGFGMWADVYPRYRTLEDTDSAGMRTHNDYLEAFSEGGPLGGLLYLCIPLLWLAGLRRVRRVTTAPWLQFGVATAGGVLAAQALVNFIFHQPGYCLVEGLYLGALFSLSHPATATVTAPKLSLRKQLLCFLTVPAIFLPAAYVYVSEAPLYAIGAPAGHEALWFRKFYTPQALEALARLNPWAPGATFYLASQLHFQADAEKNPERRAALYRHAYDYYERAKASGGQYSPAIPWREALLEVNMPNANPQRGKARAEQLFQQSLALNPGFSQAVTDYARFLADQGREADALRVLERAKPANSLIARRLIDQYEVDLLAYYKQRQR